MELPILFYALLAFTLQVHAQYNTPENTIWTFGDSAAVSFATGAPVAATSVLVAGEGCASVCDAAGNLLFYTEGTNIYNAAHLLMPHGLSVPYPYGTFTTTQGVTIVPMPGRPDKYYVFSLGYATAGTSVPGAKLVYSVVDMTLDGGMGDVAGSTTDLLVTDSLSEKMVTVLGDDCNVWLLLHRISMNHFLVYNITPTGISGPVVQAFGGYASQSAYSTGAIKVSPNRRMIVSQSQLLGSKGGTELFDFDPATGLLSNRQIIDSSSMFDAYGAEFSPDNTKLYSSLAVFDLPTITNYLWQYDLSLPTTALITASRDTIMTYTDLPRRDLKLGPDNKIYVCNPAPGVLDCIASPNLAGAASGYIPNAVSLGIGTCYSGLPNTVQVPPLHHTTTTEYIHICRPASGYTTVAATGGGTYYRWHDSSTTPTHDISSSGTYWVTAYYGCDVVTDTFHVLLDTLPQVHIGNDTTINNGDILVLTALPSGGTYIWNTGTTGDTIHVSGAGTYWVVSTSELCTVSDTIVVHVTDAVKELALSIKATAYPNPAHDRVTITASELQGSSVNIYITNMTGIEVIKQQETISNGAISAQIATHKLAAAVYLIKVADQTGNHTIQKLTIY